MVEPAMLNKPEIRELIGTLCAYDARTRHVARQALVMYGVEALPALIKALDAHNWHTRWEAAKALGEIGNPEAAMPLVMMFKDDDTGVRWAAMGSLIRIGRPAVRPLLELLTQEFASARVREGAHHVLHELKNRGMLTEVEEKVFHALKGSSPAVQVPWAAQAALMQGD